MPADVTVVMPAMNREHLIARSLDSIAAQTVAPREVVVVDDGSKDATADVARARGATVIRLDVNGGSGPARNLGIESASTTWIAFLDSDDSWEPEHLETLLDNVQDRVLVSAPGRASGGRVLGNASGRTLTLDPLAVLTGDLVCTSGTIVRRDVLVEAGLFRPLRRAQDLDMWVRVLEHGPGLALSAPTFTYYLHDDQAIMDVDLMRRCFGSVVDACRERPWFHAGDADRAWARWRWDDLRRAQRSGDRAGALREARWLATHPRAWRPLVSTFLQRRRSRSS